MRGMIRRKEKTVKNMKKTKNWRTETEEKERTKERKGGKK